MFNEATELPEDFAGVVRLFPLPNFVLFPQVAQPLHVFEPRYRELTEDALAGDQLIAMASLQPGWEADYEGRPAIFPVITVSKIMAHSRLEDGRYNLLLRGLRRAAVVREYPPEHSFRIAEVALLDDVYPAGGAIRRAQVQRDLLYTFQQLVPDSPVAQEQFEQLLSQQLPLGVLADIVSHMLPLDFEFKRLLLAEWNVDIRAEQLLERLKVLVDQPIQERGDSPFPPSFSDN